MKMRTRQAVKVDASTNNIPTAFSTAAGSLVMTGIALGRHLAIINETQSRLQVNYVTGTDAATPTVATAYVPAAAASSFSTLVLDDVQLESQLFIASDSGTAISAGTVEVMVW